MQNPLTVCGRPIEICSKCGEAYPAAQGDRCLACQDKGYYEMLT